MIPLAAADTISIVNFLLGLVGGAVGGFVGALSYAYRRGRWEQKIESRLEEGDKALREVSERLKAGDSRFDTLVRVERAAQELTGELQATQRSIADLVTRRECQAAHASMDKLCNERHRRDHDGPERG